MDVNVNRKKMKKAGLIYFMHLSILFTTFMFALIIQSKVSCSGLNPGRMHKSGELPLFNLLRHALAQCKWNHAAILWDQSAVTVNLMNRVHFYIVTMSIPLTIVDVKDCHMIDNTIAELYINKTINFIVISHGENCILQRMALFSEKHARDQFALFVHRSKWMLLHDTTYPFDKSDVSINKSPFDNVVAIDINAIHIAKIYTLLWRRQRTREWSSVDTNNLSSDLCVLFPNEKFGLNGRELLWLVQPLALGSSFCSDCEHEESDVQRSKKGHHFYKGLFVEIAYHIGNLLNVSMVFDLPPLESNDRVESSIRNRRVDLGLTYYSQDAAQASGMKGVYPLIFDSVSAAYIYNSDGPNKLAYIGGFGNMFPYLLLTVFVYSVIFFKVVSVTVQSITKNENIMESCLSQMNCNLKNTNNLQPRQVYEVNLVGKIESDKSHIDFKTIYEPVSCTNDYRCNKNGLNTKNCTQSNTKRVKNTWKLHLYRLTCWVCSFSPNMHILRFVGSHFNQGSLMRPKYFSMRVFLFFWCIYLVLMNSLFTGTLTAKFVKPMSDPPFTSVSKILQSSSVEYGTFYETELHEKSEFWIINNGNWTGRLAQFDIYLQSTPQDFYKFMTQPSNKLKVFIYYKSMIMYFRRGAKFNDLYITDTPFQTSFLGFVAPPKSELVDVINDATIRLHEGGYIDRLCHHYLSSSSSSSTKTISGSNMGHLYSHLVDFFFVIAGCVAISLIILAFEIGIGLLCMPKNQAQPNGKVN